jgi:hypothetical protein
MHDAWKNAEVFIRENIQSRDILRAEAIVLKYVDYGYQEKLKSV